MGHCRALREFFSNPELHKFIAQIGGTGAPEITIVESIETAHQF